MLKSFPFLNWNHGWLANPCPYFEGIIFGNDHDTVLRNAAKSRKPTDSVIEYDSMQENMQQIADMIKSEKQEELAKHADTPADGNEGTKKAEDVDDQKTEEPAATDQKPKSMSKLDEHDSEQWWKVAEKTMCQYIRLIVMPSTAENLTAELASHELGTVAGDACGLVMIHMDVKLSCEGVTAPFLRMPPLRPQNYEMMSQGVLAARAQPDSAGKLPKGDLVCLLNGGKSGHCVISKSTSMLKLNPKLIMI